MASSTSSLPSPNHLLLLPLAPHPLKIAQRSQTSQTQSSVAEEPRTMLCRRRPPGPLRHRRSPSIYLQPQPPSRQQPPRTIDLLWLWRRRRRRRRLRRRPRLPRARCQCHHRWQTRAFSPVPAGLRRNRSRGRRTRQCLEWLRPPVATAAASTPRPAGQPAPPPPSSEGAAASEARAAHSPAAPSLPPLPSQAALAPRRVLPLGRQLCRHRRPRRRRRRIQRHRMRRPRPPSISSSRSSCPRPRRTRALPTVRRCSTSWSSWFATCRTTSMACRSAAKRCSSPPSPRPSWATISSSG